MKTLLIILFVFVYSACNGQQPAIPRDTSFTIQATLVKERKTRPYIEVANPVLNKNVSRKKDVIYRTIAGRRVLTLDVYYPTAKKKKKHPAVLLIFGGGWRSGDKSQNAAMATVLANNGYVAVSPEYRLSLEKPYPAAVYDLKASLRWMRAHAGQYGIDTSKIAVLGCSAGGQLAALIGTTNGAKSFEDSVGYAAYSSNVQAIIDIDGVLAFHHPESQESAVAAQWLGGTYEQKPEVWNEASALSHTDKATPPVLFLNSSTPRFHGGRDDMIKILTEANVYTEVHTFPDTPHPFWFFNPWFEPMMSQMLVFLDKVFNMPQGRK